MRGDEGRSLNLCVRREEENRRSLRQMQGAESKGYITESKVS